MAGGSGGGRFRTATPFTQHVLRHPPPAVNSTCPTLVTTSASLVANQQFAMSDDGSTVYLYDLTGRDLHSYSFPGMVDGGAIPNTAGDGGLGGAYAFTVGPGPKIYQLWHDGGTSDTHFDRLAADGTVELATTLSTAALPGLSLAYNWTDDLIYGAVNYSLGQFDPTTGAYTDLGLAIENGTEPSIGTDGAVWFLDWNSPHNVQHYDPATTTLTTIPTDRPLTGFTERAVIALGTQAIYLDSATAGLYTIDVSGNETDYCPDFGDAPLYAASSSASGSPTVFLAGSSIYQL